MPSNVSEAPQYFPSKFISRISLLDNTQSYCWRHLLCHVWDDHCSEFLLLLHQHNPNHHYSFCTNNDNDDDQGWALQSTVCRLELNKKSVRAWILHLLLTGDHHDEDDEDEVDRDDEDDEDDEDYDDGDDDDGVDNENENDDDGDDDDNDNDCLCHCHFHHRHCLFTFSCFLYFNFTVYQQQDPSSLQTNIGPLPPPGVAAVD